MALASSGLTLLRNLAVIIVIGLAIGFARPFIGPLISKLRARVRADKADRRSARPAQTSKARTTRPGVSQRPGNKSKNNKKNRKRRR